MILHILYTSNPNGGAQKFALEISKTVENVVTTTVEYIDTESIYEQSGYDYCNWEDAKSKLSSFSKIIISDFRSLLSISLCAYQLSKKSKLYFIPHHDKLTKFPFLYIIKFICRLLNIEILSTTRTQRNIFETDHWYKLYDYPDLQEIITVSTPKIIFFGRMAKSKRINKLFMHLSKLKLVNIQITLVGKTIKKNEALKTQKNTTVYDWMDHNELLKFIKLHAFSYNGAKLEGISLQSLEAMSCGLVPIFYSKQMAFNLYLDGEPVLITDGLLQRIESREKITISTRKLRKALREARKISDVLQN